MLHEIWLNESSACFVFERARASDCSIVILLSRFGLDARPSDVQTRTHQSMTHARQ